MDIAGVNGWEFMVLAILAVLLLGDRMPEYAAKLAQFIRTARSMAEGAKGQLKEQLGPDYEDINWRQYDPRQYDPRRIVREALLEPLNDDGSPGQADDASPGYGSTAADAYDPGRPTPYDIDAT